MESQRQILLHTFRNFCSDVGEKVNFFIAYQPPMCMLAPCKLTDVSRSFFEQGDPYLLAWQIISSQTPFSPDTDSLLCNLWHITNFGLSLSLCPRELLSVFCLKAKPSSPNPSLFPCTDFCLSYWSWEIDNIMEQMLLKHLLILVFTDEEKELGSSFLLCCLLKSPWIIPWGLVAVRIFSVTLQIITAKVTSQNRERKIINLHCDFLFPPRNHVH